MNVRRGPCAAFIAAVVISTLGLSDCDTTLRDRIELHVDWAKQIRAEGIVYVDGTDGDDDNPGTKDLPKKTIQSAIDLAAALMEDGEVHVAEGTYMVYETIVVKEGISILGGFSGVPDWTPPPYPWVEPTTTFETVIEGEGIDTVIKPETGITPATIIQGFTIKAADEDMVTCIWCDHSSPTICYNHIDADRGDSYSFCIFNKYASPIISGNTINAGSGSEWAWGIWNSHASPKIWNNVIFGIEGSGDFRGIYNQVDCDTLIQNNTIRVATAALDGIGIFNTDSTCLVENNIFFSTNSSNGCAIYEGADTPLIEELNNNDFYQCDSCYQNLAESQLDFSEMIVYLTGKLDGLDGNVNSDPEFEDPYGGPWDWTLRDNGTNHEVSRGGKILDTLFTNDRTGADRAVLYNWSMGAYEQDS